MLSTIPDQIAVSAVALRRPSSPFNFATITELLDHIKELSELVLDIESSTFEQTAHLGSLKKAVESIAHQVGLLKSQKDEQDEKLATIEIRLDAVEAFLHQHANMPRTTFER